MSDFSRDFPENFPDISRSFQLYPTGSGIQFAKIPRKLWSLVEVGAHHSVLLVAFAMADHCSTSLQYPTFELKRSKIAKMTGLSERQVSNAVEFLTANRVLFVHYRNGYVNRYTWNEDFLSTSETISPVPVKSFQGGGEAVSVGTSETISPLYIEFILYLFYRSSFREFFDSNEEYSFYIPKKRGKENDALLRSGSKISVSRKEAWRDAVYYVFEKIKFEENPLTRIYLSLMGAYRIDDVRFPKKALLMRVYNWPSLHESLSNSLIREHLYDDECFKLYLDEQRRKENGEAQRLH